MIEVRAQLKHLRMSPKKVRLVTDAIKGMDAQQALVRLRFIPKAAAPIVEKLLKSAIANAHNNNNLKVEDLMVKNVMVNQGLALKRIRPAAFGSAHGYKKHASHINLVLGLKPGAKSNEKSTEKKKKEAPAQKEAAASESASKKAVKKTPSDMKKPASKTKKEPASK